PSVPRADPRLIPLRFAVIARDPSSRRWWGLVLPPRPLVQQVLQDPWIDRLDEVGIESGVHGPPTVGIEAIAADADQPRPGSGASRTDATGHFISIDGGQPNVE